MIMDYCRHLAYPVAETAGSIFSCVNCVVSARFRGIALVGKFAGTEIESGIDGFIGEVGHTCIKCLCYSITLVAVFSCNMLLLSLAVCFILVVAMV